MRKKLGVLDCLGMVFLIKLVWFAYYDIFFGDSGVGWHLRAGELIWKSGSPLYCDPFLFLSGEPLWVHNQWLSDLLFSGMLQLGGFALLHVFAVGLCLTPFVAVLAPELKHRRLSLLACMLAMLLAMLAASIQWLFRPVLFSFLYFAVCLRLLVWVVRGELAPKTVYFLPLLFLLWANQHPAFVLGLGLILAALAVSLVQPFVPKVVARPVVEELPIRLGFSFLLSTLATLCTPYGIGLYENILQLGGSSYFMRLNREWLAPELQNPAFWPFYVLLVLFLLSLASAARRQSSLFELLVCAGLGAVALLQRRYIPFFAIVVLFPLAEALHFWILKLRLRLVEAVSIREWSSSTFRYTAMLWCAALLYCAVTGALPMRGADFVQFNERYPVELLGVVRRESNNGDNRIFASPNVGGFLTLNLWPGVRLFIDDRNILNGEKRYRDYFAMQAVEQEGIKLFDELNFDWSLLVEDSPLAERLSRHPDWRLKGRQKVGQQSMVLYRKRPYDSGAQPATQPSLDENGGSCYHNALEFLSSSEDE